MLSFLGSVVAVGFVGCGGGESSGASPSPGGTTSGSGNAMCVVTPAVTEGPYFVDERLNRADLRSDRPRAQ